MQNAENADVLQFCHICYCNQFPKYAIMPLVKSKNNAPVPLFVKNARGDTLKSYFCRYFPAAKSPLLIWENIGTSDFVPDGGTAAETHKERYVLYGDDNQSTTASEGRKTASSRRQTA